MNILSTINKVLLILLLTSLTVAAQESPRWPVDGNIDLSSNFCDFRPLHFHGGIDIRTGGKEGRKIFAPADGYVWRIKYSYRGYGKGLYLKDNQGFIYVFGHLSELADPIKEKVHEIQYSNQRYYMDQYFTKGEVPVKKGQLIAYSGQSGAGPPHIHFEKRNPSNQPINPLTNGFGLEDRTAPEFDALEIIYTDSISVFPNGQRKIEFETRYDSENNRYYISQVPVLRGAAGFGIKAFDRIRPGGPRLNIYRAKLYIDDYLYYQVEFEKYDYSNTRMVDLMFDYGRQIMKDKDWHLLFQQPYRKYGGSGSLYEEGGIFSEKSKYSYGLHRARIEIDDTFGNSSQLEFRFLFAPSDPLYEIEVVTDSSLQLKANPQNEFLDIEKVEVLVSEGRAEWSKVSSEGFKPYRRNGYQVDLAFQHHTPELVRVEVNGTSGWNILDHYIVMDEQDEYRYEFDYDLLPDGILFSARTEHGYAPSPEIEIAYEDQYSTRIPLRPIAPHRYTAFCRNDAISTSIVKFRIYDPRLDFPSDSINVAIHPVGNLPNNPGRYEADSMILTYTNASFYDPGYMEIRYNAERVPYSHLKVHPSYTINSESKPLSEAMTFEFILPDNVDHTKVGLYRLNDKKDEWNWLNSEVKNGRLIGQTYLMGTFGVLQDTGGPRIRQLSPKNGKTYNTDFPQISCIITDGLAQIGDDTQIEIYLDGEWLIPEYEPETERLVTYPRRKLKDGRHDLTIKVSDRVGNIRTVQSHFFIRTE